MAPIDDLPPRGVTPHNLGKTYNPIVSNPRFVFSPPIPSVAGGQSSAQVVSSNTWRQPPAKVVPIVSGVIPSVRQTPPVGQPTVIVPPTNTNMVNPPSSLGQLSGVQPAVNQSSWGYVYPRNQPPVGSINYQPTSTWAMYLGIPYPGNMFTPWGKPNWSYMPAMEGILINTIGGSGGTPYGGPPFEGPLGRGPPSGGTPGRGPPYG